jgi:hypothetical protein
MVVAPGRMIDSFLSIPDAESLPLYRMVLKLACVCKRESIDTSNIIEGKRGTRNNQNIVTPERPTPSTRLRERETKKS